MPKKMSTKRRVIISLVCGMLTSAMLAGCGNALTQGYQQYKADTYKWVEIKPPAGCKVVFGEHNRNGDHYIYCADGRVFVR